MLVAQKKICSWEKVKPQKNLIKSVVSKLAIDTRNSVGRSVMFAFLAVGRPMYSQYSKMFGFIGIDHYSSRTFQSGIEEAATAFEKREEITGLEEVVVDLVPKEPSLCIWKGSETHNQCEFRNVMVNIRSIVSN